MKLDPEQPLTSSQWRITTAFRILFFVIALVFIVANLVVVTAVIREPPREIFLTILLLLTVVLGSLGIGCFLAWLSLVHLRPRSAEEQARVNANLPEFSDDALVCKSLSSRGKPIAVVVDQESGQIHFRNCLWQKRFWIISAESWSKCPLSDVVRAYRQTHRNKGRTWQNFVIETESGKAWIPEGLMGYEDLCVFFERRDP